jgi:hypothetical protein
MVKFPQVMIDETTHTGPHEQILMFRVSDVLGRVPPTLVDFHGFLLRAPDIPLTLKSGPNCVVSSAVVSATHIADTGWDCSEWI